MKGKIRKTIQGAAGRLLFIVALVVSLSSCVHAPGNPADTLVANPLPPNSFGSDLMLTQSASIQTTDTRFELLFLTEINEDRLIVAGLLPNGTRIFTLDFDGYNLGIEGGLELNKAAGKGMAPEYLLADLQLALWPQDVLRAHFAASNSCFASAQCVLRQQSDGLKRELVINGNAAVTISYSKVPHYSGTITIEHHQRMYVIAIIPLDSGAA